MSNSKVSSSLRNTRIPNEDTESVSLKNSTILEVNIVLQEKNSLLHQFFSVPIGGKFKLSSPISLFKLFVSLSIIEHSRKLHCNYICCTFISPEANDSYDFEYLQFDFAIHHVVGVFLSEWTHQLFIW